MSCPIYDPMAIINLEEEDASSNQELGVQHKLSSGHTSRIVVQERRDTEEESDESDDDDDAQDYQVMLEDEVVEKAAKGISAKDKIMLMALIIFSLMILCRLGLEASSVVAKNGSVEDTRRVYNLVWNLGYLYRDHDAYLLCTAENATDEWLEKDLDHFKDIYGRAKDNVHGLVATKSEYHRFARAFTRTDNVPSCIDGNLTEADTSNTSSLSHTMDNFEAKIMEIASQKESIHVLVDNCVTFTIWLTAILFYYAWRCIESWDPEYFERKRGITASSFIHEVAVPIIVADKTMTIKDVNEAGTAVFGWKKEEMIGENVTMLMPHSLRRNHQNYVNYYVSTRKAGIIGNTRGRAVSGIHKDGSQLKLVLNLSVSGDDKKKNPMFTALIQDVTEQLKAQEAQKGKQEQLNCIIAAQNQLFKDFNAPVIVASEDMLMTQVNAAAQATFGWSEDEMLGKNVTILMKPSDASKHAERVNRYKTTGEKRIIGQTRRIEGMHRDGTEISLILNMAKSTDATGVKFIAIFQVLT